MMCPQCGKRYVESEAMCRLCGVPLRSPRTVADPAPEAISARPPGIDRTLAEIRRDINAIDQRPLRPAGFFIRFLAYSIDNLLLGLLSLLLAIVAYVILERSGIRIGFEPDEFARWLWLLFVLPNTALSCLYFIYFHAVTGQTVGKLMCGLHVVTADGNRPLGWGRSVARCFGYFLSSFMYLGFLWVLFNRRKRGWHDYLAGTVVVHGPLGIMR
jgi:uncharacterized RDD family membrane protein YckC